MVSLRKLRVPAIFVCGMIAALVPTYDCALFKQSADWTPDSYPNPVTSPSQCGRPGVSMSWVCDPDGLLTGDTANVVEGLVKRIHEGKQPYAQAECGTAGLQGYQVAVALMRRFKEQPGIETAATAERFAKRLHDDWGVGHPACNNGVLLFLAIDNRQMYISPGPGATRALTYDVLGEIISKVRPLLREQQYNEAVEHAVVDIGLALAGRDITDGDKAASGWDDWIAFGIFASVVGVFGWFGFRGEAQRKRRYQDCKGKLEKIKRDQAALRAGTTYNPTSCPVCLEDFTGEGGDDEDEAAPPAAAGVGSASPTKPGTALKELKQEETEAELVQPLTAGGGGGSTGAAGAGATAAAGAAGAAQAAPERRPLVLPCGHGFCEPCITQWLEQHKVTCPICRRPIDEEDAPRDGGQAPAPPPRADPRDNRNAPQDNRGASAGSGQGAGPSSGTSSRPSCAEAMATDDEYQQQQQGYYAGGTATHGPDVPRLRLRLRRRGHLQQLQHNLLMDEMIFRLHQLRRQHPEYVTEGMVAQWQQDLASGAEFSAQQLHDFQLRDPASRAALASSGRSGASSSFGGGRSGGGGGRGGSW